MALTLKKGWLYADRERVRLSAVVSYRAYGDNAIELITAKQDYRYDLTDTTTPPAVTDAEMRELSRRYDPATTHDELKRRFDQNHERRKQQTLSNIEAALAELDAYFAKNP